MNIATLFSLTGKIALVTGCNKGIGKGMALALAEAGADIIGVSATLPLSGSEVEQEVRALGRRFKAYACDLSSREAINVFLAQVIAENPVIDILVNNAGTILRKPAAEHDDELWDTVLAVNLDAPFLMSREIGRRMIGRGSGKIIFTASLLTFQGGVNVPGYAASKGAIGSLVKASTSMPLPPAISPPTTPKRCATIPTGVRRFCRASRRAGGGCRMISPAPPSSWRRQPQIMSTAPF
jgi:2-deoxy-D-gluconate 3-dehydrogenase